MSKFLIIVAVMLYAWIAGVHIYVLLLQAWRHTRLERPEAYILCGALWPILGPAALGYIMAGRAINREEDKHGKDEK